MNKFMKMAIDEAYSGIKQGHGGPFGSVIVKNGKAVAQGHNHVLSNNDPTCHGEIDAIRKAGKALGTFDLSGCELYTTGEPCPMCLCACLWANISIVYYGCNSKDIDEIGFRDDVFHNKIGTLKRIPGYLNELDRDECLKLFQDYLALEAQRY